MGGRGATSAAATSRAGPSFGQGTSAGSTIAGVSVDGDTARAAGSVFGSGGAGALGGLNSSSGGYSVRVDRVVEDGGKVEVYGSVRTAGGGFAGEFGATFHREGGHLIAKTDNVLMEHGHQGKGIGAHVARSLDSTYAKLGVHEARLDAAQVGRYTWAKAGYNWSPATGAKMESSFRSWLSRNGHDTREASVASKGAKALAESKHGKAFLLSDDAPNWHGTKKL